MKTSFYNISKIIFLSLLGGRSIAQKEVVNQEINITKDREVTVQQVDRISGKPEPFPVDKTKKKLDYTFFDRIPKGIEQVQLNPTPRNPVKDDTDGQDQTSYLGFFKIGAGNYGRVNSMFDFNSIQNQPITYSVGGEVDYFARGAVNGKNSGADKEKINLQGSYNAEYFKLGMDLGYFRNKYHLYGYDTEQNFGYTPRDLKQTYQIFDVRVGFENIDPEAVIDFKIYSKLNRLTSMRATYDGATETDWISSLSFTFPILEQKLTATLDGDLFVTQYSDNFEVNPDRKRNVFRIYPGFVMNFGNLSSKIGLKAVNEYDEELDVNRTKTLPVANVSYKINSFLYTFLGYEGDIQRNTLYSFLTENPFLREQADLQNSYKSSELYVGLRADQSKGFGFNLKVSYGKYDRLYYFVPTFGQGINDFGIPINVIRFETKYEIEKIDVFNASASIGYQLGAYYKANLQADYFKYNPKLFEKAIHRPAFEAKWKNTFVISDKLVTVLDFFYIGGLHSINPLDQSMLKLKDISDLSAEINYLFGKKLGAYVRLNNIFGQNYQRYYYYPVQGFNFVVGINMTF